GLRHRPTRPHPGPGQLRDGVRPLSRSAPAPRPEDRRSGDEGAGGGGGARLGPPPPPPSPACGRERGTRRIDKWRGRTLAAPFCCPDAGSPLPPAGGADTDGGGRGWGPAQPLDPAPNLLIHINVDSNRRNP